MGRNRTKAFPTGLTTDQSRLLRHHRRGLERLTRLMATRSGIIPAKLLLVLAHRQSCLGDAIARLSAERFGSKEAVVLPGLTSELPTWLARLGLAAPVVDCTNGEAGVSVIVVDAHGEGALWRLPEA
jgi:hypothetical protein